jgi:hypothetical protein
MSDKITQGEYKMTNETQAKTDLKTEKRNSFWNGIYVGAIICELPFLILGGCSAERSIRRDYVLVKKGDVDESYVKPAQLEIVLEDVDKDGKNETIINYSGRKYLFRIGSNSIPEVARFSVNPAKIITIK